MPIAQEIDPEEWALIKDTTLENQTSLKLADDMLKKGADPNARDSDGKTPLHWAAEEVMPGTAAKLIKHGARASLVDNKGQTPLHIAALKGHKAIVQSLVQSADGRNSINHKDNEGLTPLHWVIRGTKSSGYPADYYMPYQRALEIMQILVGSGADASIQDNQGNAPIDWINKHNASGFIFKM